jgi:multicomponent Na+:H+ antiporter subunit E
MVIAQGRADAWLVGLPAVLIAAVTSVSLSGTALPRLRLAALPRFIGLFLRESIRGGIDVAQRTLRPAMRIRPGFYRYRPRLRDPFAQVLIINAISLLPGTLTADVEDDQIVLHMLDARNDPREELQRLEQAVAGVLGLKLEDGDG